MNDTDNTVTTTERAIAVLKRKRERLAARSGPAATAAADAEAEREKAATAALLDEDTTADGRLDELTTIADRTRRDSRDITAAIAAADRELKRLAGELHTAKVAAFRASCETEDAELMRLAEAIDTAATPRAGAWARYAETRRRRGDRAAALGVAGHHHVVAAEAASIRWRLRCIDGAALAITPTEVRVPVAAIAARRAGSPTSTTTDTTTEPAATAAA